MQETLYQTADAGDSLSLPARDSPASALDRESPAFAV